MSKHTNAPGAYADRTVDRRKRLKIAGISGACAAAVLVVAAVVFAFLLLKGNDIYPGVHVGAVNVGGLSRRQAMDAVTAQYGGSAAQQDLTIRVGDQSFTLSAAECPVTYDLARAVTDAFQYGRSGSIFRRIAEAWRARSRGSSIELPLEVDDVTLLKQMEAIAQAVKVEVRPSGYTYENGELVVDRGAAGYGIDTAVLTEAVRAHLAAGKTEPVELALEVSQPAALDWDALAALVKTEVREPALDLENDPTGNTIVSGQPGRALDVTAAKAMVEAAEGPVSVPILTTDPDMTDAEFRALLFRDLLGSANSTFSTGNKNRSANIKLAAEFCNDTVLLPGDVFSYNDVVGPRTAERGFKEASVYVGNNVENGLGGGICQVTSTLYMATLYADLEIVERYNHSRDVTYVPDGLDATVAWGYKDYKFRNNTEYPLRVQVLVKGGKLTVNLYGTQTIPGKEVKMEVDILTQDLAKATYVLDTSLTPGTEKKSGLWYHGYTCQSYRVIYVNGTEVSRQKEACSSYKKYDYTVTIRYNPAVETPDPDVPADDGNTGGTDTGNTGGTDTGNTGGTDTGSTGGTDTGNTGGTDTDSTGGTDADNAGSTDTGSQGSDPA